MNESLTQIPLEEILPYLFCEDEAAEESLPWERPDEKTSSAREDAPPHRDVRLSLRLRWEGGTRELTGIAHGISQKENLYIVEEELLWNHSSQLPRALSERSMAHARLLALALCHTKGLERVGIRLSVFQQGEVFCQWETAEKETLSAFLHEISPRLFSLFPLWEKADATVEFPHQSLRQGQKELIQAAWKAIKSGTKLYACAPTGIGKTLAMLYPALKALETGRTKQVYYASPKNPLKLQAAAAVATLQKKQGFRTMVLSARMSLCPHGREECLRAYCENADGFYQKLPEALKFLSAFPCVGEKELAEAARQFCICPFSLSKHYQKYCQIVIGDYNHVFDPDRCLFSPGKDSLLLVDEAHNLPLRMRENHSESLSPRDTDPFFRDPSHPAMMMREHLGDLLREFAVAEKKRTESRRYHEFKPPEGILQASKELLPKIGFGLHDGFGVLEESTRLYWTEFYRKLRKFNRIGKDLGETYATLYPPEGGVRLYLVDPREKIRAVCRNWQSTLFFSATLAPKDYYFDLLGGEESDRFLTLDSPFPRENLFVGLAEVDVSYSRRFETAPKICSIIRSTVAAKEGNYMVFLPGFEYLSLVVQEFKKQNFSTRILVQEKVMTRAKRREFLEAFRQKREGSLVGFCVMGGIFSEGVDLRGEALVGEIIVGTGFPPPSPEAEAESEAYYKRELDGKSFAYTLPGWSRVLQAAGRVIRSEEDRGVLILCDLRYLNEDWKELFPEAWEGAQTLPGEKALQRELHRFWQ